MDLNTLYETYKTLVTVYDVELEKLSNQETIKQSPDMFAYLQNTKDKLEYLMNAMSDVEVIEEDTMNLQDLRYLLANTYFLSVDIAHFYEYQQTDRLKLRVLNYLNAKRRNELFGTR